MQFNTCRFLVREGADFYHRLALSAIPGNTSQINQLQTKLAF